MLSIMTTSKTQEEYMSRMLQSHPGIYMRNHMQVAAVAAHHFGPVLERYVTLLGVTFNVLDEIRSWVLMNMGQPRSPMFRPKTLYLKGEISDWEDYVDPVLGTAYILEHVYESGSLGRPS